MDSSDISILCDIQNNTIDVTRFQGEMTIPIFQFRDSLQFIHRKMHEHGFLKRRTHSLAGFVTFCLDGSFVKCFRHGPSVISQF